MAVIAFNYTAIVEAQYRDKANAIAEQYGEGSGCFSIPVYTSGIKAASHWGTAIEGTDDARKRVEKMAADLEVNAGVKTSASAVSLKTSRVMLDFAIKTAEIGLLEVEPVVVKASLEPQRSVGKG